MSIRKFFHNSGDVFLPESIKNILSTNIVGSNKKTFYISGWTIMHFISGVVISLFLIKKLKITKPVELFLKLFIIHTLWEFWQIYIGTSRPFNITGHNNIVDTIIDTISFLLGSLIVYQLTKT